MKKGAFTLVELLVVISILAILGTLAFISLSGYTVDARNAKRVTDLGSLEKLIQLKNIKGDFLPNFVDGDGSKIISNISIGGMTGTGLDSHYFAGDINYQFFGINKEDFSDPTTGDSYKIGVTTHLNKYEIAGTFEEGIEEYSIIRGNWTPRNNTDTRGTTGGAVNGKIYIVDGNIEDTGLVIGDNVRVGGNTEIFKIVNMGGNKIFVDKDLPLTDNNSIYLNKNESRHLIKKWNSDYPIYDKEESISRTNSYKDTPYQIYKPN